MQTIPSQNYSRKNSAQAYTSEAPERRLSTLKTKTSRSLDNKETIFPRAIARSQQRKARKYFLNNMASESMKACATSFTETSDETSLMKHQTRGVRFSTLQTCKSVNCPRCAANHQRTLRDNIEYVYNNVLSDKEGAVALVTLTKGYYKYKDLKVTRQDLVKSMGNLVKQLNKRWDLAIVYIVEATFDFQATNPSAHYHIHALMGGNIDDTCYSDIEKYIRQFWKKQNKSENVKSISDKAQDIQWVKNLNGLASYLSKAASFELTGANTKGAQATSRTTWFQYLNDLDEEPSQGAKKMVHKFLSAEKGTRKYSTNKKFREVLNGKPEEEEEKEEDRETELATFNVYSAREMLRYDDGMLTSDDILSLLERSDEACEDFKLVAEQCDNYYYDGYDAELARGLMLDGLTWLIDKYIHQKEGRYWADWRGLLTKLSEAKASQYMVH